MPSVSREDILQRVNKIFRDTFDDDSLQITDETSAVDIEDWDSLAHVTLIVDMEKEFGLRLKAAEIGKLSNVGAMIDLFMTRI